MILSAGRDDVMAEMTSVRHSFTFSVIPSLSIMIIYTPVRGYVYATEVDTYVSTCINESIRSVDKPTRVTRARGF